MRNLFIILISSLLLQGCLSVARISDFPSTTAEVDFDKYLKEDQEKRKSFRTFETSDEYYIKHPKAITDEAMVTVISRALVENGYRIFITDTMNNYVIGKRGLRANEWNARTGVYYRIDTTNNFSQIYINTRITQDFTGGFRDSRAKKVGVILEFLLKDV